MRIDKQAYQLSRVVSLFCSGTGPGPIDTERMQLREPLSRGGVCERLDNRHIALCEQISETGMAPERVGIL